MSTAAINPARAVAGKRLRPFNSCGQGRAEIGRQGRNGRIGGDRRRREGLRDSNPNLRRAALRAEGSPLFHGRATLMTGILH